VSAPFGFYLALLTGLLADGFVAGFCPPAQVISGLCAAAWHLRAGDAIIILSVALAAVLVVFLPTLLAPERRLEVAVTFYLLGAATAFLMVRGGGIFDSWPLLPIAAALSTGALTLLVVRRFLSERPTSRC